MIHSFPESVVAKTNLGQYPFMIAACTSSSPSLSLVYELVRTKPVPSEFLFLQLAVSQFFIHINGVVTVAVRNPDGVLPVSFSVDRLIVSGSSPSQERRHDRPTRAIANLFIIVA